MQKSTQKIKIIDKKAVNKRLTKLSHLFTAFFLLIALISAPINFVQSAFNPEINYQGKLTDSAGVGVTDGDYNMEFKLYTVSSGGTAIWTETLTLTNKVTVASGLFSVLLGNITSIAGVDFNQDLYLGVNIGGTGTASWDGEMTPRKQIASVPSAFEADQLDGLDSTQFLRSDEADTMSASSASTLLSVVQSGVGNILSLFDGATEVFTVKDGGNVGIGTTSPSSLLHLRSSNPIQYITSDNTGQSSIYFGGASDSDAGRIIYSDNDDSLRISTNNSEALRILNSGNVGIGITSPSAKLDVDGATLIRNSLTVADTTTKAYSSFGSNSTSHGLSSIQDVLFSGDVEIDGDLFLDASTIEFAQASTTGDFQIGGVLLASDGTALSPSYTFTADTDTGLFRAGINALGITTAGSEALRVDANGNIGIGTTAPGTKLDIGDDT
ncbi:MAG: hypothetical protein KAS02_02815, partial [Candidatus Pacebacteria bacterium]|nr:hypothetical protein [Candidatus Paceibacterota bacterium]